MSRLFCHNCGDFFVNHIGHRTLGAGADIFVAVCHPSVPGAKGVVCSVQHMDIVFRIPYAHQDPPSQLLLQLSGGHQLADPLGVDIGDPGQARKTSTRSP